jgi:hypothetical protein
MAANLSLALEAEEKLRRIRRMFRRKGRRGRKMERTTQ